MTLNDFKIQSINFLIKQMKKGWGHKCNDCGFQPDTAAIGKAIRLGDWSLARFYKSNILGRKMEIMAIKCNCESSRKEFEKKYHQDLARLGKYPYKQDKDYSEHPCFVSKIKHFAWEGVDIADIETGDMVVVEAGLILEKEIDRWLRYENLFGKPVSEQEIVAILENAKSTN